MKLYVDSAHTEVIEPLMRIGVFYGVTTNPLLLREAGLRRSQLADFAHRVFGLGAGEIFFQSWGEDCPTLYGNGRRLAGMDRRVVVKLPVTRAGIEAASLLASEGIRTCVTAVYAPFQAVLAAASGAAFVAPYLGRMDDAGRDGHAMIAEMAQALRSVGSHTEILAASVRAPEDVTRLAFNGVRCITLSPPVAEKLFEDPFTLDAVGAFEAAAAEVAD